MREREVRRVYDARKKIRYTDGDFADFSAAIAASGRAALNRFGRVIAIPPLRFHATFAATSADLAPSPCPPCDRISRPPCGQCLIKYHESKKKLGTHILLRIVRLLIGMKLHMLYKLLIFLRFNI